MFPQANRDQLPSKSLRKGQKPRKEQEILFPFLPKHEIEERPVVLNWTDLSLMSHKALACKDLGTMR